MASSDCQRALYQLYTYLDGELTDEHRSLVMVHLEQCSHCFGAFDFEAELRIVIATRAQETIPPHLLARVREVLGLE